MFLLYTVLVPKLRLAPLHSPAARYITQGDPPAISISMIVRIENPERGKRSEISHSAAVAMIARNKAVAVVRVSGVIVLIRLIVKCERDIQEKLLKRQTMRQYDSEVCTGQLTQRQAKHVPFAGDLSRMGLAG